MKPDQIVLEEVCPRLEQINLQKMRFGLGLGLISSEFITEGQIISSFADAPVVSERTYLSVQVSETEDVDDPYVLARLNHSCDPNVFVDAEKRHVEALKDIEVGTVLTFFYPQTEWHMSSPFDCHCKADACLGSINGAEFLRAEQLAGFKISPHIQRLIQQRDN